MRPYETLIMEMLKGETPKAKYEWLKKLVEMFDLKNDIEESRILNFGSDENENFIDIEGLGL